MSGDYPYVDGHSMECREDCLLVAEALVRAAQMNEKQAEIAKGNGQERLSVYCLGVAAVLRAEAECYLVAAE